MRNHRRRRRMATLAATLLVAAGCGSYHSAAELRAAAGATGGALGAGEAVASTNGSEAAATERGASGAASSNGSVAGSASDGGVTTSIVTGGGATGAVADAEGNHLPLKIGEVGLYSGIGGAVFESQPQAVRAWVDYVNSKGGINGHPIELSVVDDGGDPARHRAAVQSMINDGVVAFVGNSETLTGRGSMDLINGSRIPVIGSDTGSPHYYESPMYFPEGSNANPKFYADLAAAGTYATANNITRLATLTCTEAQSCGDADGLYSGRAHDFGVTVVSRARVSIAQPDFTAECINARNANAQMFLVVLDGPSVARLAQSCARTGLHVPIAISSSSIAVAIDPNVPTAIFASVTFPWILGDTPARAEFQEVFSHYPNGRRDTQAADGWAAASMFGLAATRAIGPNDTPSAAAVLEGLWSFQGETLGGLTAPLTFTRDQPAPQVTCFFPMYTRDGEWHADSAQDATCPTY